MHTFKGPNGTTFHYNSDLSGEVYILTTVKPAAGPEAGRIIDGEAEVSAADLVAFADHTRDHGPDRERIEFIRRAATQLLTAIETFDTSGDTTPLYCWQRAEELWKAKPEGL
jgi:hypothetical protein